MKSWNQKEILKSQRNLEILKKYKISKYCSQIPFVGPLVVDDIILQNGTEHSVALFSQMPCRNSFNGY